MVSFFHLNFLRSALILLYSLGEVPVVRILTPKPSPTATANQLSKTKGCCFIEFTSPLALQAALRLHEEELQGRKLNVELTAGGGGNSTKRTEKIVEKRKTLTEERERTKKNKAEREGTTAVVVEGAKGKNWNASAEEVVEPIKLDKNGKKVRDRRSGKSSSGKEAEAKARKLEAAGRKASSGANAQPLGK